VSEQAVRVRWQDLYPCELVAVEQGTRANSNRISPNISPPSSPVCVRNAQAGKERKGNQILGFQARSRNRIFLCRSGEVIREPVKSAGLSLRPSRPLRLNCIFRDQSRCPRGTKPRVTSRHAGYLVHFRMAPRAGLESRGTRG